MAGFEVKSQVFGTSSTPFSSPSARSHDHSAGLVSEVTPHLLTPPIAGLLGLAWEQIANSGAKPFWQALAESPGALDSPVMGVQLTRYLNDTQAEAAAVAPSEPGGTFTLGGLNETLFEGEVDYQAIPAGQVGFWLLEMTGECVRVCERERVG